VWWLFVIFLVLLCVTGTLLFLLRGVVSSTPSSDEQSDAPTESLTPLERWRLKTSVRSSRPELVEYLPTNCLLTDAEGSFFKCLQLSVNHSIYICPKVRLADILEPAVHTQADFNRISSKHVDFLLCDKHSMKPVLVLELNDRSHSRLRRQERDEHLKSWLKSAGIPFLQIRATRGYNVIELRSMITSTLAGVIYVPSPTEQKLEANQNSASSGSSPLQPDHKYALDGMDTSERLASLANTAPST